MNREMSNLHKHNKQLKYFIKTFKNNKFKSHNLNEETLFYRKINDMVL